MQASKSTWTSYDQPLHKLVRKVLTPIFWIVVLCSHRPWWLQNRGRDEENQEESKPSDAYNVVVGSLSQSVFRFVSHRQHGKTERRARNAKISKHWQNSIEVSSSRISDFSFTVRRAWKVVTSLKVHMFSRTPHRTIPVDGPNTLSERYQQICANYHPIISQNSQASNASNAQKITQDAKALTWLCSAGETWRQTKSRRLMRVLSVFSSPDRDRDSKNNAKGKDIKIGSSSHISTGPFSFPPQSHDSVH